MAAADRRRVSECFNELAAIWCAYNFGVVVAPPKLEFVQDEDLQAPRAKRDVNLYAIGWRPKKSYITREYDIPEEDFELNHDGGGETEAPPAPRAAHSLLCGCTKNQYQSKFKTLLTTLFANKKEKARIKDKRLMNEFKNLMLEAGQGAIDEQIKNYVDALGNVDDYKEAHNALLAAYSKNDYNKFAALIDEVRFVGQGLGGAHGKRT